MKGLTLTLALLLPFPTQAQELTLSLVEWVIDEDCPGTENDDTIEVRVDWEDFPEDAIFYLERAVQVTATSCPEFVQVRSVIRGAADTMTFKDSMTTATHKASLWRLIWFDEEGTTRVRDFLFEPPGGGDTCAPPPLAPDCPEPSVSVLDEPQIDPSGASWDLGGEVSVVAFDASGFNVSRTEDPIPLTDTYLVSWPGPCPCTLVALSTDDPQPAFALGNGEPLILWNDLAP